MNRGVGGLSGHDDEFASLFQGDNGRTGHEVVGNAGSELANGGARAGADDDSVNLGRSRGGLGTDVLGVLEDGVGGFGQGFGRHVALVFERDLARVGDHEADGLAHLGEDFGEAHAVDGSGGA